MIYTHSERSMLITPGSNYSMLEKAAKSQADAICFDLEDGVAMSEKESSRKNIIRAFKELDLGESIRMYRINGLDTKFAYRDLIEVVESVGNNIDLVMIPKVNDSKDVYVVDTLLTEIEKYKNIKKHIGIEALIETAMGCLKADEIASSSPRLETLIYGPGDFAASVKMPSDAIGEFDDNDKLYPGHRWHYAMQRVVIAARAYGRRCVDGPFAGIYDHEGFKRACEIARVLGFDGKWAIHPDQIEIANLVFSPLDKQIEWAEKVVKEFNKAAKDGKGAISLEGKMIDMASHRMATNILEKKK